jgi:hypothetical protein
MSRLDDRVCEAVAEFDGGELESVEEIVLFRR